LEIKRKKKGKRYGRCLIIKKIIKDDNLPVPSTCPTFALVGPIKVLTKPQPTISL
jgi:hypothetical protein